MVHHENLLGVASLPPHPCANGSNSFDVGLRSPFRFGTGPSACVSWTVSSSSSPELLEGGRELGGSGKLVDGTCQNLQGLFHIPARFEHLREEHVVDRLHRRESNEALSLLEGLVHSTSLEQVLD